MSERAIAAEINLGLARTAAVLGLPHHRYRPQGSGPVIAPGNLRGVVMAHITTTATLLPQSAAWGKADRFGAFDPTNFLAGDYLVGAETYFGGDRAARAGAAPGFVQRGFYLVANAALKRGPGQPCRGADGGAAGHRLARLAAGERAPHGA